MVIPDNGDLGDGAPLRVGKKLADLLTNLTMIQLKLFLDNSDDHKPSKLVRSSFVRLCGSICLQKCPHTITVTKYTEYYGSSAVQLNGYECSRSRENIACVYNACLYNGDSGEVEGKVTKLVTQRLFPHVWLLKQSK